MATANDSVRVCPECKTRVWFGILDAWRDMCNELGRLGIDINERDHLARLIELWGEELVQLRLAQEPALRSEILLDRRQAVTR